MMVVTRGAEKRPLLRFDYADSSSRSGCASDAELDTPALGIVPNPTVQFACRAAVGILVMDRAPCRKLAGTPPGSDACAGGPGCGSSAAE